MNKTYTMPNEMFNREFKQFAKDFNIQYDKKAEMADNSHLCTNFMIVTIKNVDEEIDKKMTSFMIYGYKPRRYTEKKED